MWQELQLVAIFVISQCFDFIFFSTVRLVSCHKIMKKKCPLKVPRTWSDNQQNKTWRHLIYNYLKQEKVREASVQKSEEITAIWWSEEHTESLYWQVFWIVLYLKLGSLQLHTMPKFNMLSFHNLTFSSLFALYHSSTSVDKLNSLFFLMFIW